MRELAVDMYLKSAKMLRFLNAFDTNAPNLLKGAPMAAYLQATRINLDAIEARLDYLHNKVHIDVVNAVSRIEGLINDGEGYDEALRIIADRIDMSAQEMNETEILLSLRKGEKDVTANDSILVHFTGDRTVHSRCLLHSP